MTARILLALAAAFLLATPDAPEPERAPARTAATALEAVPVALDASDPARRRLGPLRFRGGWVLRSPDPAFGGISALHVAGGRALAVTDAGMILRFAVPGAPGAGGLAVAALEVPGSGARKVDRDSESLVVADGRAWIGFEGRREIRRYALPGFAPQASAAPEGMRGWGANSGAEAMLRLADGRFLVFAEGEQDARTSPALLFDGDPAEGAMPAAALSYRPPPGYRVTDAALLPDGRMLLLNRRFTFRDGVSARLVVASVPGPGAETIEGEEVAALAPPLTVDNMEALSVAREAGRTIVWIASDDNFNPLQRTLLMRFEWVGE